MDIESGNYVASLGELGAAGPDGFSRRTTSMPTRQLTISDAANQVAYSARTADTPEAADRHIKAGGFRRVSDWTAGICSVERIPSTETRRKKLIIAGSSIAAVLAVVAGCSALASVKQPTPTVTTPAYVPPSPRLGP